MASFKTLDRCAWPVRRVLVLTFLIIASSLALAGCFGESTSPVTVKPYLGLQDISPGRATHVLFHLASTDAFKQRYDVVFEGLPAGWSAETPTPQIDVPGRERMTLTVNVTAAPEARFGPQKVIVKVGDTRGEVILNVKALSDAVVREGIGARVLYVAVLDNGTLLASNEPSLHNASDFPQMSPESFGLDGAGPNASVPPPLKVYVERGTGPAPEPYGSEGYARATAPWMATLLNGPSGAPMRVDEFAVVHAPAGTYPEGHPLSLTPVTFLLHLVGVDALGGEGANEMSTSGSHVAE